MVAHNEDTKNGKVAGLAFHGKSSLVQAMRLLRYVIFDSGDGEKSKIAIAEYKLKRFYLTNRNVRTPVDPAVAEQEHVVRIMNVHLHNKLVNPKYNNRMAQESYGRLWDTVARLVRGGLTSNVAIDRIYGIYGRNATVTDITNSMLRDRRNNSIPAALH